jgi:hypothetical protein
MSTREGGGTLGGGDRLANAYDRGCPCGARTFDDGLTVGVERRIREMRVTVDEVDHGCTNRRARRRFVVLRSASGNRSRSLAATTFGQCSRRTFAFAFRRARPLVLDPEEDRTSDVDGAERSGEYTERHDP